MNNEFLTSFEKYIKSLNLSDKTKKGIIEFTYNLYMTLNYQKVDNSFSSLRENLKQLIENPPDISNELKIKYIDYLISNLEKK